jgi:hypothetical protein
LTSSRLRQTSHSQRAVNRMASGLRWGVLTFALAATGLALSTSWAALGQDKAEVRHNGYIILRVRVGVGGLAAVRRADEVQLRLQALMSDQLADERRDLVGQVRIRHEGRTVTLRDRGRLLIEVTEADARACNSTRDGLAELWRRRVVKGLIMATRTG